MCTACPNKKLHNTSTSSLQHHKECKRLPTTLGTQKQPLLAVEPKISFTGNKNKTGFSKRDLGRTKSGHDEVITTNSSQIQSQSSSVGSEVPSTASSCRDFSLSNVTHAVVDSRLDDCKPPLLVESTYQPQLAESKLCFLGNKNETGFFYGDNDHISTSKIFSDNCQLDTNIEVQTSDVDSNVMDTDCSLSYLDRNCSRNNYGESSQTYNSSTNTEAPTLTPHLPFGFIPKGPLTLYTGPPVVWQSVPDILQAHFMIKTSGLPNYLACRIPIESQLQCKNWAKYLHNYWDQQLLDLLTFGFPLDFNRQTQLTSTEENHASAVQNSFHVDKYLTEELQYGAMLGPFDNKPISSHISPLMVRDKQDSDNKRTIMDLSWPKGQSVNDGICKDIYLGTNNILKYPSVDSITASLRSLGPAAMI